jgi:hypothetical protein
MNGLELGHALTLVLATWAIESIVCAGAMTSRFGWRSCIDLFWINLLTNPVANFAYTALGWPWLTVESLVTVAEILPIARSLRIPVLDAARLSLLANGVSAAAGLAWARFV